LASRIFGFGSKPKKKKINWFLLFYFSR
jgi:hypothetical protein